MSYFHENDTKQNKLTSVTNSSNFQKEGVSSSIPPPFKATTAVPQMKEDGKEKEETLQKKENRNSYTDGNAPIPPNENTKYNTYHSEPKQFKPYQLVAQKKAIKQFKQHSPFQLKDITAPQKNQGGLPQEVQAKMENSMGHDFSNVNIHKNSKNATDAGALAYAQGNDVHFAPGQFKPDTTSGQELIGHELAHVVQQREGRVKPTKMLGKGMAVNDDPSLEKEADDMGRKAARGVPTQHKSSALGMRNSFRGIQAKRVAQLAQTHYGVFDTIAYNDVKSTASGTPEVGVNMHLKFSPNSNVDSTKIGLVQIAKGVINGSVDQQGYRGRRMATNGAGQGHAIDRIENYPNPVYITNSNPEPTRNQQDLGGYGANTPVAATPTQIATMNAQNGVTGVTVTGWGTYGHRYMQNNSQVGPVDATLQDAPQLGNSGNNSEQIFETAALAIEGSQKDTYYGSVEWGWRRDGRGNFTRLPLKTISEGVPSNNFMTAAEIWNGATENISRETSAAIPNLQPITFAGGRATPVTGASPVIVPANMRLDILASGRSSDGTNVIVARVVIGGSSVTTIIPEASTRTIDVGRPTVDLPIVDVYRTLGPTNAVLNEGIQGAQELTLDFATTRLRRINMTYGPFLQNDPRNNMVEVEIVDGPHTGTTGWIPQSTLVPESRGSR